MKYSEARQILEKNGMELDEKSNTERIYVLCQNDPVVTFSKETCYLIDSYWGNDYVNKYQMSIAQKVAYKLSRTNPEDRENDPKKYYLRILNLPDINDGYVNLDKRRNKYILSMSSDSDYYQTLFTDDEIKQMQKDPMFENIDLEKCKEEPMPF